MNPFNTNVPSTGAQATKKKTVVMAEPRTPLIKSERRPLPKPNIPEPEEAMDEVDSMTVGVEITTKTQKDADIQHLSDSQGNYCAVQVLIKPVFTYDFTP